jgi:hypothetical protein
VQNYSLKKISNLLNRMSRDKKPTMLKLEGPKLTKENETDYN